MLEIGSYIDLNTARVYRDDEDELRFYVLPKDPSLKCEGGKARFQFIKYRTPLPMPNGKVGAALVAMTLQLALTSEQEAALRKELVDVVSRRLARKVSERDIVLSRPQIKKCEIVVNILADAKTLVEQVNHAGTPSLYGDNVVAISAQLTQEGAPAFEASMKGGGDSLVQVVYKDMECVGRMPPIKITGTWYAARFYSFLQRVDYQERFWSEDDFSECVAEVSRESDSYHFEVSEGMVDPKDEKRREMIDSIESSLRDRLDKAVERNLLKAIPAMDRDFSSLRKEDIENIRRQIAVTKIADVSVSYERKQVVTFHVTPQGNMRPLVSQGFNWNDYAMEIDLDDPFFKQLHLTIQVNADFVDLSVFSVEVLIDYPPHSADHGIQTFVFRSPDDVKEFTAFTNGGETRHKYRYVVSYRGESRVLESDWTEHDGTHLTINVGDLGVWPVDVEIGDLNFSQVSHALVTLEHPTVGRDVHPRRVFQLDEANRSFKVRELLLAPVLPYHGSVKFFMRDGRELVRDLGELRERQLYVNDPFSVSQTIRVRSRGDFERDIDTIFLELSYVDERNNYQQTSSVALSKDQRSHDWTFPTIDEQAGVVSYRTITTFHNGRSEDSGAQRLDGTLLLVGPASTLTVTLISDLVPWDRVKLVTVDLHYQDSAHGIDERESFLFRSGATERVFELGIRDHSKKGYSWAATFFLTDGTRRQSASDGEVTDEHLIIELPTTNSPTQPAADRASG